MDELATATQYSQPFCNADTAVMGLDWDMINDYKNDNRSAVGYDLVNKAMLLLLAGEKTFFTKDETNKLMKEPIIFIRQLRTFNKDAIDEWVLKEM